MIYEVGQKVIVSLNPNEQIHSIQEVWGFQNAKATISRRKIISYGRGGLQRGAYYELNGVESKKGVPFCFLEEQLIPIYGEGSAQ